MRKIYLIFGLIFGLQTIATAQLTCGDILVDSGGSAGDYTDNEVDTITICPGVSTDAIQLIFSSFDLEDTYDFLYIYDANGLIGTPIATYTGLQTIANITAENPTGCLTLLFTSDGSVTAPGFEAIINCVPEPSCFKPTAILAANTTDISSDVSWTSGASETQWLIEYGPAGFTPGTGTQTLTSNNPFTINGLTELTDYDVYLRSFCGIGDTSAITSVFSFTTTMTPLPPFICGNSFTDPGGALLNYDLNLIDTNVICPTNSGEVVVLTFSDFDIENGWDSLMIYNGNTVTDPLIGTYTGTVSPGVVYSTSPNGCLTVLFHSDDFVTRAGWVAAISCQAPITCLTPSNVTLDANTDLTATISWTAGASETQWIVEYDTTGFVLGTGNQMVTSNNPLTISGLTELTAYDFYVRAFCAVGDTSFSTSVFNFSTSMTPLAPFICGNQFTDEGGANGNYSANTQDTIVICPANSGDAVSLVFSSFDTENNYDTLFIYDDNTTSGNLLAALEDVQTPGTITATNASGCLTAVFSSDGSVQRAGWVADITCAVNSVTCFTPSNIQLNNLADVSVDVSWTAGGTETQWVVEYDTAGFVLGTGTQMVTSNNPVTISGLLELTTYDFYVRALCSVGDSSANSFVTTFTTTMTPLAPFICGNLFTDAGGVNAPYSPGTIDTIVICPSVTGDMVSLVFTQFDTENGFDSLMIFDGNSLSGQLIGTYQGLNDSIGTIMATNSTGCLTALFMSDGSVQNAGWSALIDCQTNVVTCNAPSNLTATNVGLSNATLNWVVNGTETAWLVEYGPAGFTQGSGTTISSTSNSLTIGGLNQNTSYNFYVTAICADSATSTVGVFTTLNNAGIYELEINSLSISPNPSNGKFVITNKSGVSIKAELFDAQGRKLNLNLSALDANKEVTIDLSNFDNGVYFIKTQSSLGNNTYSLVKN